MSKESKKTNALRSKHFIDTYLSGRVIDIGAGDDLVVKNAERFDLEDGDANKILNYRKAAEFDAVHSSHCLEHMEDPKTAVSEWWELVRPGGFMIIVVPDEDLYEQGYWPSRFNSGHNWTFTFQDKKSSWSPVSINILDLLSDLPNAEIVSCELQDNSYDYALLHSDTPPPPRVKAIIPLTVKVIREFLRPFHNSLFLKPLLTRFRRFLKNKYGVVYDQTTWDAVAQIQVVLRKKCFKSE